MKVARTYTIDYDLVVRLARKQNQSKEVCKAIRKHLDGENNFELNDVPTRALLASLQSRYGQFDAEYNLILTLIAMCKPS